MLVGAGLAEYVDDGPATQEPTPSADAKKKAKAPKRKQGRKLYAIKQLPWAQIEQAPGAMDLVQKLGVTAEIFTC